MCTRVQRPRSIQRREWGARGGRNRAREYSRGQVGVRCAAGINIRGTGGVPIYNGDIIDDYLRFRVDNRKFWWQKGAGRFETEQSIYLTFSPLEILSCLSSSEVRRYVCRTVDGRSVVTRRGSTSRELNLRVKIESNL